MTYKILCGLFLIGTIGFSCKQGIEQGQEKKVEPEPSLVFAKGEKINNDHFIGDVWLEMLVLADSVNKNSVGSVTFGPGARTNWHTHPNGQIILAIEGEGFYQEKGSPKKILQKGDAVKCPPNTPHWHGASSEQTFIQIAISNGVDGPAQWLEPVTDEVYNDSDSKKILVVYLSRTNNTKTVAEIIHEKVGGDLVALELENPYPENYRAIVEQVASENESGFLPPLKTQVDTDRYDTIFIGFPTWGMQLPPPMKSFLHDHNLKGKTVVLFNTHGGYGLGSTVQTVRKLCPDSEILQVFSVRGGSERDGIYLSIRGDRKVEVEAEVEAWLKEIQLRDKK